MFFFNNCNSCNRCCNQNCCCNRNYTPINTLPRPPIPPIPPVILPAVIGTYNASAGIIATGATLPLGTQYYTAGSGATYQAPNAVTLTDGIYRVSYGADATGTAGIASLSLASGGGALAQSTSTATLAADTDIARLGSTIVVDAQTTPVTLTLVNSGTTDMTFNNITLTATEIS